MSANSLEMCRECVDIMTPLSIETIINGCLTHFNYDDAIALSEAYYAKNKSDEALNLHAQCLMRSNRLVDAYEFLKREGFARTSRSRFLFAKCAYELKRLDEADCALRGENGGSDLKLFEGFDEATVSHAHALLAKIFSETNRMNQSKKHYGLSLTANPMLWSSIKSYCQLGGESIGKLFGNLVDEDNRQMKSLRKLNDRMTKANQLFGADSENTAPQRIVYMSSSTLHGKRRKSNLTVLTPTAPNSPTNRTVTRRNSNVGTADKSVTEWIFLLSEVQELLSQYRCDEALEAVEIIPQAFQQLPLTLLVRGTILFENMDYKRCVEVFRELRRIHPTRIEGMETYSTALWQLQDHHQLSALAAELMTSHRESPITWCVVGNSLSLQKHHEAAIEAFERAIQLRPRFAYAYSLLGHELVGLNKLTNAQEAFTQASIHAPNDYRALYGQGQVYYKSEQYLNARAVLSKAANINPRNTVLLCQLAIVEHALRHHEDAMVYLNRALQLQPNSVVCRFHRARLLFDKGDFQAAEKELNELKVMSPDEAHVFFLLGRVYRKLNNPHLAMLNFAWATEIDPRGEQNNQSAVSEGTYDDDAADTTESERRNNSAAPF
ncbi:hypothetical protein M3Y94_00639100 [Aphelenchoides besseyi]|nr:hypothetical protein M3Y94_00639100 [Aphelenchoides besseyi]KAI6231005.1 TPR-REGION domain-containing protein [Aphelenchoides besseyi]